MNQRLKQVKKLEAGQALTFDEINALLLAVGFICTVKGSHHKYVLDTFVIVIPRHGKTVKAVYQKQVREVFSNERFNPKN